MAEWAWVWWDGRGCGEWARAAGQTLGPSAVPACAGMTEWAQVPAYAGMTEWALGDEAVVWGEGLD